MAPNRRRQAVTLLEVLVVISIVATLAAVLFPVLGRGREAAFRTACLSNEKQIGLAMALYATDYDGYFPPATAGKESLDDGLLHDISWIAMIEPYAERILNIDDRGKAKSDVDAKRGVAALFICPLQTPDERAGLDSLGDLRLSSGGVGVSYGLPPYANGGRPLDQFVNPSQTILSAEQFLNFANTYYYPVDNENDPAASTYGYRATLFNDCRFDRPAICAFPAGVFPAHPSAMPGIGQNWVSNLGSWHGPGQNFLFADSHARYQPRNQTYRVDGSFSEWTLSLSWRRAGAQ
jgi:prepilin-type N-terminal cleavage/methylation domain-containing protein